MKARGQKNEWKDAFKGKKVTILGLGVLGKGLGDAQFLAKNGAALTVTDLKTRRELTSSIAQLKKYPSVRFALGGHKMADFEDKDFILKAQGVPLDSPYIAHARAKNIPIRMDDELFASLAPEGVTIIGVTGTRGKTTVASLIYHILKSAGKRAHLGGNIRGVATLALLPKVRPGDIVVLELSSWQLQGFADAKRSPHIAVFTNFMPDHMNYYKGSMANYFKDKAQIFIHQKKGDLLVTDAGVTRKIPKSHEGKRIVAAADDVPKSWKLPLAGEHNRLNVALALAALKPFRIPPAAVRRAVEHFKAVDGRLARVRVVRGITIYNDNNATTPSATVAALAALPKGKIILISGGADKGLPLGNLSREMQRRAKAVILLSGNGTDRLRIKRVVRADSLRVALAHALKIAEKGDSILFSPAFASFGMFKNEYDRNDQFMKLLRSLK